MYVFFLFWIRAGKNVFSFQIVQSARAKLPQKCKEKKMLHRKVKAEKNFHEFYHVFFCLLFAVIGWFASMNNEGLTNTTGH